MPIREMMHSGGGCVNTKGDKEEKNEQSRYKRMVHLVSNAKKIGEQLFLKPPKLRQKKRRNPYSKKQGND